MDKWAASGYPEVWREEALSCALKGYERILSAERRGLTKRNRPGVLAQVARRAKALAGKSTWYLPRRKEEEEEGAELPELIRRRKPGAKGQRRKPVPSASVIEGVIFIPHTRDSALRKELNTMEEGLRFTGKVKYVEELGPTLESLLVKKDPWGKQHCGRDNCLPCRGRQENA